MLLHLTDISDEPLQSQISRQIRAKILTGELPANTNLPSIRALATKQKVSVITVQRAYESLTREGIIHSRRGKGFYVSEIPGERKRELAWQRLLELIERPINAAMAEGLSADTIKSIVEKILNNR